MNIIECADVRKFYHPGAVDVRALDGVSLTVSKGDFVAIAGPSGSGKTTLLNLIGGLDRVDSGSIHVAGENLAELSQAQLADLRLYRIGFVFQAFNLIPVLSAVENVEFVMLLQGVSGKESRERASSILDEVGLKNMYHRCPHELSGGQQQRVAVARAIVSNPAVVLADEPTANLDSKTGNDLLELMQKMNERFKVTFVFSTHDQMVMSFAGRLIRLRDGRIVAEES
jgi:putative ABC transport system ATP-binding protein